MDTMVRSRLDALSSRQLAFLWRVQRRAVDGIIPGIRAWDPHAEARLIQALEAAELIAGLPTGDAPDGLGLYQLAEGLPPPPALVYDFEEAFMPAPDDLEGQPTTLASAEGDLAALAASYRQHPPRRTVKGTLDVATLKKVGARLADARLAATGRLSEAHPRWLRAQAMLEVFGLLEQHPISRELWVTDDLRAWLDHPAGERYQRLALKVVDTDLRPLLPAIRAALTGAVAQAIDEVVFVDLLAEQHREVLFSPWGQVGLRTYPRLPGEDARIYDRDGFDHVEGHVLSHVLRRLARLGLLKTADGVFAATDEGRAWAGVAARHPRPPMLLSPDLSLVVPPGSLEPWERYLLERFAPATLRDVVDQHRLDRRSFRRFLTEARLEDALALLERRTAHGVPDTVRDTLVAWAAS